ncbi:MAG: serine/threonine-protein kinase [Acidobacteria bacterium]|nr:serine/threonine-protein kinase [Acidobacteriota bacterium]
MTDPDLEARFERWVAHHVADGRTLDPAVVCADRPELAAPLAILIEEYLKVCSTLEQAGDAVDALDALQETALPAFEGFRTIERIAAGGMGEVYKLHDLRLDRMVAAKVVRTDRHRAVSLNDFLKEARTLALFQDRRIVQIYEFRPDSTPPVLIMEYVDGFELGKIGPSLEYPQRARILKEVCEAIHNAHTLGLQHRDLKPANIMLDAQLRPRILDFGLSAGDPARGHFRGTPRYLAPEQLDPSMAIDRRTDVYALGAVLYELLCGLPPFEGRDEAELLAAVRAGTPRLPVEIEPSAPEPLQAIALKALEHDPRDRYPSAHEMALDLGRYLEGRPVFARPSQYVSVLATRVRPHLQQIEDWLRLKLIYAHEAATLRTAYRHLDRREDDWIGESRSLSYSQIALYLGAFTLMCGSLFYFGAHRFYEAVTGVAEPFVVLGLPFIGLNVAAHVLARRDHKAVSVAFYLGGVSLLPLFLLILFHETKLWVVPDGTPGQLFSSGVSNLQLQVTVLVAWAWSAWLALRTRTIALSTVFTLLALLFVLSVLGDFGLRVWIEKSQWDRLALHLLPLVPIYALFGFGLERSGRAWFSGPLYTGAGLSLVIVMELLALDGKLVSYLGGLSLQRFQSGRVSDPLLLDTLAGMSLNGVLFYTCASAADARGTEPMKTAAWLLFTLSPFAILEPLAYLNETAEYSRVFDWSYLGLALVIALVSHRRQRKSFYYAGLVNSGVAFWMIADHYKWFDKPAWAMMLVVVGLVVLVAGFGLDARERRQHRPGA